VSNHDPYSDRQQRDLWRGVSPAVKAAPGNNFRLADDPEVVAWSLGLKLKATLYRVSMRACFRRLRYSWAAFSASSSRGLLVARCPSS
jgi:hypothetical protein